MILQIIGDNLKLSEDQQGLIREKLGDDLDKFIESLDEDLRKATVKVTETKRGSYIVSFVLWLPGNVEVFDEEEHSEFQFAVTAVKDAVQPQLKKYRETH